MQADETLLDEVGGLRRGSDPQEIACRTEPFKNCRVDATRRWLGGCRADGEKVTLDQRSAAHASNPARDVRGTTAENRLYAESASATEIAASARFRPADDKRLSLANVCWDPRQEWCFIQRTRETRASQNAPGRAVEAESPAKQRHLQSGRAFGVSSQEVSQAERNPVCRSAS